MKNNDQLTLIFGKYTHRFMSGAEESSALMQHSPNALCMQNQLCVETIDAALYSPLYFA